MGTAVGQLAAPRAACPLPYQLLMLWFFGFAFLNRFMADRLQSGVLTAQRLLINRFQCHPPNQLKELPAGPIHSPLISCHLLPNDFVTCDEPLDLRGNLTARQELGYGCVAFGGQKYHEVEFTSVKCEALPLIECHGSRTFMREGVPCIRYTTHYFLTTLLYSILLGLAGIDRFCLGHVGAAVGKLLTLGGAGLWWIIDIILLISGQMTPEDGSNWIPYV